MLMPELCLVLDHLDHYTINDIFYIMEAILTVQNSYMSADLYVIMATTLARASRRGYGDYRDLYGGNGF